MEYKEGSAEPWRQAKGRIRANKPRGREIRLTYWRALIRNNREPGDLQQVGVEICRSLKDVNRVFLDPISCCHSLVFPSSLSAEFSSAHTLNTILTSFVLEDRVQNPFH